MLNIYTQNSNNEEEKARTPASSSTATPKADFKKYVDAAGDFDSQQLQYSIWYIKHKVLLYRLAVGVLVAVSVGLWGYSLWHWFDYAVTGLRADTKMLSSLGQFPDRRAVAQRFAAKQLQVLTTQLLSGGVDKYDAVAEVTNPNPDFYVAFDYTFSVSGEPSKKYQTFLLPGETRPITDLGLSVDSGGQVDVKLENIRWKRISKHTVPDPALWQGERLQFAVENFQIHYRDNVEYKAHAITFTVRNNSNFSYKEPFFHVGLYQQGILVGIMPLYINNLRSLEARPVDLRNFVPNLSISDIQIFPAIDVYDQEVYSPPV